MKKIALLAFVLLTIACQKKEEKGYKITADTEGFQEGSKVYINAISQSNRPIVLDSTTIQKEKFQFNLPSPETTDFNFLTFQDLKGHVLFMAENNPIHMLVYKDSLEKSIINGGKENKAYFLFVKTISDYVELKQKLGDQQHISNKLGEGDKAQKLGVELQDVIAKEKEYRISQANKSESIVSVLAINSLLNVKTLSAKEAKLKFDAVNDTIQGTRLGKNLNQRIDQMIATASLQSTDIGAMVADFSAPNPEGKTISLKESLGKITILDFWASWCKPCRVENPHVLQVYNKYHDKGLNIIGISLDKKKESWVRAIKEDKLPWEHVSNLQFWQEPIAKAFGIRSIPATYILDESGAIIAKNLRGQALEQKIEELLTPKSL